MLTSISVITPSFNQGQFIERTIQSVLSQNIENLEYVIFDGGSNDNTVEILKKYDQKLKWVSERDKGQTHAVNKGIMATSGEIIGWLNSDDIYYSGAIEYALNFFKHNPDIDIIYGKANYIDKDDQVISPYDTEEWDFDRLLYTCFVCQPAVFFRRKLIESYGLLDEKLQYCMDYEYWIRLSLKGVKFVYVPELLAGSRLYAETKTLGSRLKVHREINNMLKHVLGYVPERWITNYSITYVEENVTRHRNFKFKACLFFVYLYSGLKWNKAITRVMLSNLRIWIFNHG